MNWSRVTAIVGLLSLAALLITLSMPPSIYGKVACVAVGLAFLYLGSRAVARGRSPMPQGEPGFGETGGSAGRLNCGRSHAPDADGDTSLDSDLVARILDKLKGDPSEHLRAMLALSSRGRSSAEALQAARLLLDQRSNNVAPEPAYRTARRAAADQNSREHEAVAPRFSRDLLSLDVGSRVDCRWRGESGTIMCWDDEAERFFIRYDSGEGEWATLGMFR